MNPRKALKDWKRDQVKDWLKHRRIPQVFKGSADKELKAIHSMTTEQLDLVLFVARLSYAKGHKDGRDMHADQREPSDKEIEGELVAREMARDYRER